jgi:MFS family permease
MFMDFTTLEDIAKEALNLDLASDASEQLIAWTYSASLLAVLPAAFPAMVYLQRRNWLTTGLGTASNCVGAWLRYVAVKNASIEIAIVSSVFVGFAAAVIVSSYSAVASRWFPPSERTLATSLAVQSNYAGWCLGAVVIPYCINKSEDLLDAMFYQAIYLSFCLALFFLVHRENPIMVSAESDPMLESTVDHEEKHEELSALESLKALVSDKQYVLQCLCYSTLAGVSFAIPAFQTTALATINLTSKQSAWTNFAFVLSGVVTGLCAGFFTKSSEHFPKILKTMFVVCSIALAGLVVLTQLQDSFEFDTLYTLLIVCMGFR